MINAAKLLDIREAGFAAVPVDRIFLLLTAGYPELSAEQIGQLTLGEKEVYLLQLREQLFGVKLECVVDCPHCGELLEFGFSAADIGAADYRPSRNATQVAHGLTVRPLTLNDLRMAGGEGRALLGHAISLDNQVEKPPIVDSIRPEAVDQVSASLLAIDPLMNIHLDLNCSGCGEHWSAPFETISYLWAEIERWGEHMLQTIHLMADAYGWSEQDVLAMSAWRRQRYVEMIT